MVALCCGSLLPVFGARVSVTFHLMCVRIIFSSVWVAIKDTSIYKYLVITLTNYSRTVEDVDGKFI